MKTLVVYESYFGNTEKIAQSIYKAFEGVDDSLLVNVDDFKPDMLDQVKLLIAGTPTRAFQPSPKIKKFMNELPAKALQGFKVASFDTRADETDINNRLLKFLIKTFGYAAEPLAKKLKRKGGHLISKPEGFFIQDTEGPLKKDELERAEEWGRQIRDL